MLTNFDVNVHSFYKKVSMKYVRLTFFFIVAIMILVTFVFFNVEYMSRMIKLLNPKFMPQFITTHAADSIISSTHVDVITFQFKNNTFLKGYLKNDGDPLFIYLHHQSDYISSHIIKHFSWEDYLTKPFKDYIINNPGIQVLDAGCNVGVYTLIAAMAGCRVIAIDANVNNTDRLVQSLLVNNLAENVTILLNAISNQRTEFILSKDHSNIGGQYVIESKTDPNRVRAIIMDDLLPFFDESKPIVIKMDIEGEEIKALENATKLFKERNVTAVSMEWFWIKKRKNVEKLTQFLINRNFTPFTSYDGEFPLDLKRNSSWLNDLVWIRQ